MEPPAEALELLAEALELLEEELRLPQPASQAFGHARGSHADDDGAHAAGDGRLGDLGVCYGLVVRSMGFTGGMTASFKALAGVK